MAEMMRAWGWRVFIAGLVAGVGSMVAQLIFLLADWQRWPCILGRDSRMAASVVLGSEALGPHTRWPRALAAATVAHFLVAWLDAAALAAVLARRHQPLSARLATGALYGAAAYGVRLYVLAPWYPWTRCLRSPAYLLTHVAHGIITALALRGPPERQAIVGLRSSVAPSAARSERLWITAAASEGVQQRR